MTGHFIEVSPKDFTKQILDAVSGGIATSFMRFNDGEAKFVGTTEFYPSSQIVQIIRRQFGDNVLTDLDLVSLKTEAGDAVRNATVVGLPPADWPKEFSSARDVVESLVKGRVVHTTHVDFHQHLFGSDFFAQMFTIARPVSLVTCRDVSAILQESYKAKIGRIYSLPEQADGSVRGDIRPHFPMHCGWLSGILESNANNHVFLVGAGICGKIYCEAIRRGGGVAIDVGSIFDLWAGRFSRPYMQPEGIRSYYFKKLSRMELSPAVIRACAEIHTVDRDYDAALRILTLGQETWPHLAEFYLRYIRVSLQSAEPIRFAQAVVLAQMIRDGLTAPELVLVGRMFKVQNLRDESGSFFGSAFDRDPFYEPALTELCGDIVGKKGPATTQNHSAILAASIAAAATGSHPLLFQLARVHGARGDFVNAVRYCGEAITKFSFDAHYLSHQIAWLRELGRISEADTYAARREKFRPEPGTQ